MEILYQTMELKSFFWAYLRTMDEAVSYTHLDVYKRQIESSALVFGILIASILVKLYMFFYNHSLSKQIESAAMTATSVDSLSDTVATTLVLIATLISKYTGLLLDGWFGILVGLFILYTGGSTPVSYTHLQR